MSKFCIKRAKAGEAVTTLNDVPVRIICWDRKVDVYEYIVYLEINPYSERILAVPVDSAYLNLKMAE